MVVVVVVEKVFGIPHWKHFIRAEIFHACVCDLKTLRVVMNMDGGSLL